MKYRHTKTGAIIEISCEITGNWEPVEEQAPEPEKTEKPKKAPAQKRTKK